MHNLQLGLFSWCQCKIAQMHSQCFIRNEIIPTSFRFLIPMMVSHVNISHLFDYIISKTCWTICLHLLPPCLICNMEPVFRFITFLLKHLSMIVYICLSLCADRHCAAYWHDIIVIKFKQLKCVHCPCLWAVVCFPSESYCICIWHRMCRCCFSARVFEYAVDPFAADKM